MLRRAMPAGPGTASSARRPERVIAAAIAVLAVLPFARALGAPFHFDDGVNIVHNPFIRWTDFDLAGAWRAATHGANRRPLAYLSFALDYRLGGYAPAGFHAVNLALHAACSTAVFALARRLLALASSLPGQRSPPLSERAQLATAALAAALFAVHPLQSQTAIYIVQRMTSLAALFYLLALLAWLEARRAQAASARRLRYAAVCSFGVLALASKEIAITLPAAIALVEWLFVRDLDRDFARRCRRTLLPLLALVAAAAYYAYFQGPDWGYRKRDFSAVERIWTEQRVLVFYLSLFAWPDPSRFSIHHVFELSRAWDSPPTSFFSALFLGSLLALSVAVLRRERLIAFGALWFFLHHALESSFLPLEIAYEHRNYLPMFGLCLAAAFALARAAEFFQFSARLRAAAALALIAGLGAASAARTEIWLDGEGLWRDALAKAPGDTRALHNLGVALAGKGRENEAIELYREVIAREPENPDARRNLAAVHLQQGRADSALPLLEEALHLDPDDPYSLAAQGDALRLLGRPAEAEAAYRRALAQRPEAQFFYGLAEARAALGAPDDALHWYAMALRTLPEYAPAAVASGKLLAERGRTSEAVLRFESVLARYEDPESHSELSLALRELGRHAEALAHAESAYRLAPHSAIGIRRLAFLLATCPDAAQRDPRRALALAHALAEVEIENPDPRTLDALAAALAASGDFAAATRATQRGRDLAIAASQHALAGELGERALRYARGEVFLDSGARSALRDPASK
jgi:tetratricopeptide (TPR) repeat protein